MVTGGAFTVKSYEKKHHSLHPRSELLGREGARAGGCLTYYTNADSMIADLKGDQVDWVDQVPFNAVDVLKKDSNIQVNQVLGFDQHHVELEPLQGREPRAPRPAGEEGALDVHRSRQDHRGRLQRLRGQGREPARTHFALREQESGSAGVRLRRGQPDARRARLQAGSDGSASPPRRPASTRSRRTRWSIRSCSRPRSTSTVSVRSTSSRRASHRPAST